MRITQRFFCAKYFARSDLINGRDGSPSRPKRASIMRRARRSRPTIGQFCIYEMASIQIAMGTNANRACAPRICEATRDLELSMVGSKIGKKQRAFVPARDDCIEI